MKFKSIFFLIFTFTMAMTISFISCKKNKEAEGIDKQMLDMAQNDGGYTWYKHSSALLNKSSGSGHNYPYLKTRYNGTAATMLDTNGMIMDSVEFPEGSFIVKDLYSDASTLGRYAMLYKQSNNSSADANGWVWGYIDADGNVAVSAEDKGKQCISCHSQEGNIDYMLMNKFFP
jgi:hypothetical protein